MIKPRNTISIVSDSVPVALALKRFFKYVSACNINILFDSISEEEKKMINFKNSKYILNKDSTLNDVKLILKDSSLIIFAYYHSSSDWLKRVYEFRCKANFRGACIFLSLENLENKHPLIFKTFMRSHHKHFLFLDVRKWKEENIFEDNYFLSNIPKLSYTRLRRAQRNIRWTYKPVPGHGKINYADTGGK